MKNNNELNLSMLSPARKLLVTNALVGHELAFKSGDLTSISRESLSKVGLTEIEISAIENGNKSTDLKATFAIPNNTVPSSENNPFSSEKWDPEMQRNLHETDPALNRQLMLEARVIF